MDVIFSQPAQADLLDILAYITNDNVPAALAVVDEIEDFCLNTLSANPRIGTAFKTTQPGIRLFPKKSYNIFYRIQSDQIEIVRVLHHSRLAASILR